MAGAGNQGTVQKIGSITSGKIWRPITFKVIYKFPKQPATEKQQPVKCVVADDSGLITLLVSWKDEKSYDVLKVNQFYTIMAGGCFAKAVNSLYKHLYVHPNGVELWVGDQDKIVKDKVAINPDQLALSSFNFNFTDLSKLSNRDCFDIFAKVQWQGPEENGPNETRLKKILLVDESVGKKQALTCYLKGDHRKLIRRKGQILAIFNAYIVSEANDLVIHVNNTSAAFVVTTGEWDWILSNEQRQRKDCLMKMGYCRRNSESRPEPSTETIDLEAENHAMNGMNDQPKSGGEDCSLEEECQVTPTKIPKLQNESAPSSALKSSTSSARQSSNTPNNCCSISDLKSLLNGKRRTDLDIEINAVHLSPNFVLRRYLGCAKCSKSLRVENGSYVCYGKNCCRESPSNVKNYRNDPAQRKSFYLLKNLEIKDNDNQFVDNLIAYNPTVQEFLNKDADEFESDSLALDNFTSLIKDRLINVAIKATRAGTGAELKNRWTLTVKKISTFEDSDALCGGSSSSDPLVSEITGTTDDNYEFDIRTFLARRSPFEISVVGCGNSQLPQNDEDEYIQTKKPRGIALHIYTSKGRDGSDIDKNMFQELFKQLNYTVITVVDAKSDELHHHINECRKQLVDNRLESFVLCISGHGLNSGLNSNNIQLADDTLINIWTDLIYQFDDTNFQEFRGRPKIVLVNACQSFATEKHIVPFSNPISSPNHPDFLVFIATSPGFQAFRNAAIGTHFMRAIACVFMKHAHNMEIKKLFYLVAKILHSPDESAMQKPQLPEIRDFIFSKQFFFRP